MRKLVLGFLILTSFSCFSQSNGFDDWTVNEKANYKKLTELAKYINGKEKSKISKDLLFEKYILFDYVLKDTIATRKEKRIQTFDTLFYYFRKQIDSVGIGNLDAKPIRFYKDNEIYKPFEKQLAEIEPNVFAYFEKSEPENPKGTLWFDPKTNKLIAWILINQGGYRYFLTFNLM